LVNKKLLIFFVFILKNSGGISVKDGGGEE
jgi:hypothetical protein